MSSTIDPRIEKLNKLDAAVDELVKTAQSIKKDVEEMRKEILTPPQPSAKATNEALEKALEGLKWTDYPSKNGAWAFYLEKSTNKIIKPLAPFPEFITQLKEKGDMTVGSYKYKLSGERFLQRFTVSKKPSSE